MRQLPGTDNFSDQTLDSDALGSDSASSSAPKGNREWMAGCTNPFVRQSGPAWGDTALKGSDLSLRMVVFRGMSLAGLPILPQRVAANRRLTAGRSQSLLLLLVLIAARGPSWLAMPGSTQSRQTVRQRSLLPRADWAVGHRQPREALI